MNRYKCLIVGIAMLSLAVIPTLSSADCSCAPTGGSVLQGMEFVAKSCQNEGDTNSTNRVYVSQWVLCSGGKLTINTMFPASEGVTNVNQIINTANSYNNTKILRNEAGTHIIAVHRYYQGKVAGLTPTVGVITHDNLNQYCTHKGNLPDSDQDGFPDCLDCADTDPANAINCPPCLEEKIARCGTAENAQDWTQDGQGDCQGVCKNSNYGPHCGP